MIYDCVMLFNELDLLELRFSELEKVVDRFVVAEATVTHAGRPKRLAFAENRQRFARWDERVVHVVVEDMPKGPDPWSRERYQRNALIRGLRDVGPTDGVIISDADEIPKPSAIRQWSPTMGLCGFEQLFCYYWINCVGGLWAGSRILRGEQLRQYGDATAIRHAHCPLLKEGGWHFSFLGGPAQIATKLEAYAHQDLNVSSYKDQRYLDQVINVGMDLFGRSEMRFSFWPVDERFPACVLANRAQYDHLIREAEFHEIVCNRLHVCLPEILRADLQSRFRGPVVVVHEPGVERSVAGAWNRGCELALADGADYIAIAANDTLLREDCLDNLIEYGRTTEADLWSGISFNNRNHIDPNEITDGADFSCFMIRPKTLINHGFFDPNYRPAYFEDNDYYGRVILGGGKCRVVHGAQFLHHGSMTLRQDPEMAHHVSHWFERNRTYFCKKWGVASPENSEEGVLRHYYRHPFNDVDKPLAWFPTDW